MLRSSGSLCSDHDDEEDDDVGDGDDLYDEGELLLPLLSSLGDTEPLLAWKAGLYNREEGGSLSSTGSCLMPV